MLFNKSLKMLIISAIFVKMAKKTRFKNLCVSCRPTAKMNHCLA